MPAQKPHQPPKNFAKNAAVGSMAAYKKLYDQAARNPEAFWGKLAKQELHWFKPWKKTLDWKAPFAKWFAGGTTNMSYNCLDRHLTTARKNKAAIIWEGEPGDVQVLTYQELHRRVCRFANVLKGLGLRKGSRSIIYMPMIPELPVAMLACARLGITHSVVFGGFSAEALKTRIIDLDATVVITADGGWRRGKIVPLKETADEAMAECPGVKHCIVYRRTHNEIKMKQGRDHDWSVIEADAGDVCPAAELDSEHPLYVLYTSGTTGKPKGIVHTTGGYQLQASMSMKWVFDIKEEDTYWCAADIGWVTGHTYIVYGPLLVGTTTVMYEGAPIHPEPDRFWRIIDKYKINILYTSPTAIRAFIRTGEVWPNKHDLSSLRLLGSVGEPINPAAWDWYHKFIGGGRCPIVDTWWQTETGSIMISPLPGATPLKPGSATFPLPGVIADVVDMEGNPVPKGGEGYLVIRKPWPSMFRTLWRDKPRFKKTYWSQIPGVYFVGDAARRDLDGYIWVLGRVDDVMNVSGHRLSTAELESALVKHSAVAEAAVIGKPHELTGQAIVAFVTLKTGHSADDKMATALRDWVAVEIGKFARPEQIRFTEALPKTRSGKIMRRLLREIVTTDKVSGDITTLEDLGVINRLASQQEEE
ncbi:MAG TPA: acetate--CoA ligase [Bryobacterales bacterium]|nr:acetate--CoA ligase [Bryobacterales bacterium]